MKNILIATTIITAIWSIVDNNLIPSIVNIIIITLVAIFND